MSANSCALAALLFSALPAAAQIINAGTIAPEGSPWHLILQRTGQEWKRLSNGAVSMRVFAGTQGDEADMLQRARLGQLQAVMVSGAGAHNIDRAINAMHIPMMIDSYEELDFVFERMRPKLEDIMLKRGFVVLNWGDVGWVRFFARRPLRTLSEVRRVKVMIGAGDADAESLYKDFGFQVVPLAYTDMLMSLQAGMVDSFAVPPLFALLNQSFGVARNMIDLRWAPLIGATVITTKAWERIPAELRPKFLEAARWSAGRYRPEIRESEDVAIREMTHRGLNVIQLDPAQRAAWQREVEAGWSKIRGRLVSADLFDEVLRLRNEFRNRSSSSKTR